MKNIVYLTQYAVEGQIQSQFYNYSRFIDKNQFNVKVFYLFPFQKDNSLIKAYSKNGIEVFSLNFTGARISLSNLFTFIKVFSKLNIDIVHSQHPIAGFYNKIGIKILNSYRRKKIKIITEQRCNKKNLSKYAQILELNTHFLSDLVINSSDSVELSFFKTVNTYNDFINKKKCKHITLYNSIDTYYLEPFKKKTLTNITDKKVINICFVGRLESVKQPLAILQALKLISEFKFHLFIAGEGSLEHTLQNYIKENEMEGCVTMLGNISNIPKLLNSCDLFVNYSKHEGLCKAILEAMSVGLPVIASRVSGNIEVIGAKEEFGLLADSNNIESLKENVVKLITSNNLYKIYSLKVLDRINDFEVRNQVKKVEKIYSTLSL